MLITYATVARKNSDVPQARATPATVAAASGGNLAARAGERCKSGSNRGGRAVEGRKKKPEERSGIVVSGARAPPRQAPEVTWSRVQNLKCSLSNGGSRRYDATRIQTSSKLKAAASKDERPQAIEASSLEAATFISKRNWPGLRPEVAQIVRKYARPEGRLPDFISELSLVPDIRLFFASLYNELCLEARTLELASFKTLVLLSYKETLPAAVAAAKASDLPVDALRRLIWANAVFEGNSFEQATDLSDKLSRAYDVNGMERCLLDHSVWDDSVLVHSATEITDLAYCRDLTDICHRAEALAIDREARTLYWSSPMAEGSRDSRLDQLRDLYPEREPNGLVTLALHTRNEAEVITCINLVPKIPRVANLIATPPRSPEPAVTEEQDASEEQDVSEHQLRTGMMSILLDAITRAGVDSVGVSRAVTYYQGLSTAELTKITSKEERIRESLDGLVLTGLDITNSRARSVAPTAEQLKPTKVERARVGTGLNSWLLDATKQSSQPVAGRRTDSKEVSQPKSTQMKLSKIGIGAGAGTPPPPSVAVSDPATAAVSSTFQGAPAGSDPTPPPDLSHSAVVEGGVSAGIESDTSPPVVSDAPDGDPGEEDVVAGQAPISDANPASAPKALLVPGFDVRVPASDIALRRQVEELVTENRILRNELTALKARVLKLEAKPTNSRNRTQFSTLPAVTPEVTATIDSLPSEAHVSTEPEIAPVPTAAKDVKPKPTTVTVTFDPASKAPYRVDVTVPPGPVTVNTVLTAMQSLPKTAIGGRVLAYYTMKRTSNGFEMAPTIEKVLVRDETMPPPHDIVTYELLASEVSNVRGLRAALTASGASPGVLSTKFESVTVNGSLISAQVVTINKTSNDDILAHREGVAEALVAMARGLKISVAPNQHTAAMTGVALSRTVESSLIRVRAMAMPMYSQNTIAEINSSDAAQLAGALRAIANVAEGMPSKATVVQRPGKKGGDDGVYHRPLSFAIDIHGRLLAADVNGYSSYSTAVASAAATSEGESYEIKYPPMLHHGDAFSSMDFSRCGQSLSLLTASASQTRRVRRRPEQKANPPVQVSRIPVPVRRAQPTAPSPPPPPVIKAKRSPDYLEPPPPAKPVAKAKPEPSRAPKPGAEPPSLINLGAAAVKVQRVRKAKEEQALPFSNTDHPRVSKIEPSMARPCPDISNAKPLVRLDSKTVTLLAKSLADRLNLNGFSL